jgi:hypothetical protein
LSVEKQISRNETNSSVMLGVPVPLGGFIFTNQDHLFWSDKEQRAVACVFSRTWFR